MADTDDAAALHQLALQEAVRSLAEQTQEVRQIRDRVVSLIALSAVAAAFLVGAALDGNTRGARFYIPLTIGTTLFVLLIAHAWAILRPIRWNSKISPVVLLEDFADGLAGLRELARYYDEAEEANNVQLNRLQILMQRATAIAGAMILCWVALAWFVAS